MVNFWQMFTRPPFAGKPRYRHFKRQKAKETFRHTCATSGSTLSPHGSADQPLRIGGVDIPCTCWKIGSRFALSEGYENLTILSSAYPAT
jgi:hypothetical protein